jgi:cytochrome c553
MDRTALMVARHRVSCVGMRWLLVLLVGACGHTPSTPPAAVSNESPDVTVPVRVIEWQCVAQREGTSAYELVVPAGKLVRFALENGDDVPLDVELPPVGRVHLEPGERAEVSGRYDVGAVAMECPVQVAAGGAPNPGTRELRVVSESDYAAYLRELGLGAGLVKRGEALFDQHGCSACHSVDGTPKVGSTMAGLWGEEVTLIDGSTFTVDATFIKRALVEPQRFVRPGFPAGAMPSYEGQLSASDMDAIAAYIASLD